MSSTESGQQSGPRGRGSSSGSIWTRPAPGARKPRFTREQIAAAAMTIADTEGIEAVTMRRVADELGAGTMTLYHYVGSKSELTVLVVDRMMGELLIPEGEMPTDWREAFTAIAHRSYQALRRHGWIHEQMAKMRPQDAEIGKNGLRHFEQSLQAAALTGLPVDDQLELISFVDDYVFGFAIRERDEPLSELTPETEPILDAIAEYVSTQLKTGEFPHIEALLGGRPPRQFFEETFAWFDSEYRFERGLRRMLDGMALEIERQGS